MTFVSSDFTLGGLGTFKLPEICSVVGTIQPALLAFVLFGRNNDPLPALVVIIGLGL